MFHVGGSALPFFVMGGLGVPLLLYVARLVPEDLRVQHDPSGEKAHESSDKERGLLVELLRRKKVLVVLLTAALSNGSYAFLDPVLEPHMVRDLPSEAARIADDPYTATGLLFFWSSLIYTLAAPVTGYISAKDRLGSDNVRLLLCSPPPVPLAPQRLAARLQHHRTARSLLRRLDALSLLPLLSRRGRILTPAFAFGFSTAHACRRCFGE